MNVLLYNEMWLKTVVADKIVCTKDRKNALRFENKKEAEVYMKALTGLKEEQYKIK